MVNEIIAECVRGPNIQEVHIDFLLWEELHASTMFLSKFVEACMGQDDVESLIDIRHSVSDQFGEADLVLQYRSKTGDCVVILIEVKICAGFQPSQADRYKQRGEKGKPNLWDRYVTCLIAPEKYIRRGHKFMKAISLESISEWIDVSQEIRRQFKLRVLNAAIKKEQQTGTKQVDETVTNFRMEYFNLLKQRANLLIMNLPKPTWSGENWFKLKYSGLPKKAYIHHKADRGYVDLTFPNMSAKTLQKIEYRLEHGMSIEQTNKSAAIRLKVPCIDVSDDFAAQIDRIILAYEAAMRLAAFCDRERDLLLQI